MTNYQAIYDRFKINLDLQGNIGLKDEQKKAIKIALVNSIWTQMGDDILSANRKRIEIGDVQVQLIESINFKNK